MVLSVLVLVCSPAQRAPSVYRCVTRKHSGVPYHMFLIVEFFAGHRVDDQVGHSAKTAGHLALCGLSEH